MKKICVLGMGYVGLTLAVTLAQKGFRVTGVEEQATLVENLNQGNPHFHEPGLEETLRRLLGKSLFICQSISMEPQDAFIIAVGSPVNKQTGRPIMDYVIRATKQAAECLREGNLVIMRSTVPPGTCRKVILPILKQKVRQVYLAYCPERTAEGVALKELRELPQIVGGLSQDSVDLAYDIFRTITPTIVQVSSLEGAEMIKLMCNSYRDLTFAFANELALVCEHLGLDAAELIKAANTGYLRANIPTPGFVGGTCLRKDPHLLVYTAQEAGYTPVLVQESRRINETLTSHLTKRIIEKMSALNKSLRGARVLVAGFAFKGHPETDDLRDSPTLDILDFLKRHTTNIYGHDYVVKTESILELGAIPCSLEEGFNGADLAIFMNNHRSYYSIDIQSLALRMNRPAVILDGWHLFDPDHIRNLDGVVYGGIGIG